jgi:hypothetical protein
MAPWYTNCYESNERHLYYYKQVGTPTLPTAIPLKSSSSMRATLVFNLFFK